MKSSLLLYRAVLRELDKYEAPAFSVGDFNYFFNKGKRNVVNTAVDAMETDADAYQLVEPLLRQQGLSEEASAHYLLPAEEDILKILSFVVTSEGEMEETAKVLLPSQRTAIFSNAYRKPTPRRPYYEQLEGKVVIYNGGKEIIGVTAHYVINAPDVIVARAESERVDSILSSEANRRIVEETVRLFLENTESRRYQTQLTEEQLKRSK